MTILFYWERKKDKCREERQIERQKENLRIFRSQIVKVYSLTQSLTYSLS